MQAHDSRTLPENASRRAFLKSAPIAATALLVPATAEALEEMPVEKVNRLGWELAHALNDYADGNAYAMVYPSDKRELAVGFMFDLHETQEEKVKRLVRNLQHEMGKLNTTASDGKTQMFHVKMDDDDKTYLRYQRSLVGDSEIIVGIIPALNT